MPYYVRILTPSNAQVHLNQLRDELRDYSLRIELGTDDCWEQLVLGHPNGTEIAVIERNVVSNGALAEEEIEEFLEESEGLLPESGANWLRDYLPSVGTIYAFQILSGADEGDGWAAIGAMKSLLWNELGGIFQADGEGFTNEDGYHIVWQFSKDVTGPWWMAVLINGRWETFQMELGNKEHREQFFAGKIPEGIQASCA